MRCNRRSVAATARTSRSRTPRARQKNGARMRRANVRSANRSGGEWSSRPHRCATFCKRRTTT
eukprot:3165609-Lingulodinium_polyedra.AAC.1